MRPPRCFSIGCSAAWHSVKVAVRLVASTASQSSRFIRSSSWSRVMPALLTRMSIRPCRASDAADRRLDSGGIGDVERHRLGASAGRHDRVGHGLRVVAARRGHDRRALAGQRLGDGAADAARRARDERHSRSQIHHES